MIDSEDYSRYHAMELKLERRFADGFSYLVGYTLSRSKDTRSYDPAFTVVSTANNQSASSTPFDINNRDLNYALSDFDRTACVAGAGRLGTALRPGPALRRERQPADRRADRRLDSCRDSSSPRAVVR